MYWRNLMDPDHVSELEARVIDASVRVLGNQCQAVTLKGSAIFGDFFPYFSDFDVHVYVDSEAMGGRHNLRSDLTFEFQAEVGTIEPEDFRVSQVQINFLSSDEFPNDWTPPIPGTYRLSWGALPDYPQVDAALLKREALRGLLSVSTAIDRLLETMVDKPDQRLSAGVRLVGTFLKPALRQSAILLGESPREAWTSSLESILATVESATVADHLATEYFEGAARWRTVRDDGNALRLMGLAGIRALEQLTAFAQRS